MGCGRVSVMKIGWDLKLLFLTLRVALGTFFVWSGGSKAADFESFVGSVENFQLEHEDRLGEWVQSKFAEDLADVVIAYGLPWFEIFAGLAVISGVGLAGGLTLLGGMLVSFNLALWSAWNRGIKDLKCGCHGASDDPTNYFWKITGNFGLMAVILVIFGLMWHFRRDSYKELT